MNTDCKLKEIFTGYLTQLQVVVEKIPDELFAISLAKDMFPLGTNAKIAANFVLRGYCPLVGDSIPALMGEENSKSAVLTQIEQTLNVLLALPAIGFLDNAIHLTEKAGDADIHLGQEDFIFQYIIPNYMFHMGMVYAVARSQGIGLSKGDFDGLHKYVAGFSFIPSQGSSGRS